MSISHSNRRRAALASLFALLSLTACGAGEDTADEAPVRTEATDEAPAQSELPEPATPTEDTPATDAETEGTPTATPAEGNPFVDAEQVDAPVDGIAFEVVPSEPVSLEEGGTVEIHWAGTAGGTPVSGDSCQGMLSVTTPTGQLLTFKPEFTGCIGTETIQVDAQTGAIAGDYVVQVTLDDVEAEQTVTVAP